MPDEIAMAPSATRPALAGLVMGSALAECVSVTTDGDVVWLIPIRPVSTFSTGEAILWRFVTSMLFGDLYKAVAHLDRQNRAILHDTICRFLGAERP